MSFELDNILQEKVLIENTVGLSGDTVYKIENYNNNENAYLKIENNNKEFGIKREYIVYKFLEDKIKVPKVLLYEYPKLITSEIEGICSFGVTEDKRMDTMRIIAYALKELHSIDISDCNFYSEQETKIRALNKLEQSNSNDNTDYVFVHGDACLPNISIKDNEFNGFIDMGAAGIGNRYIDLACVVWSTLFNFKDKMYVDEFFKHYGKDYYNIDIIKKYIDFSGNPINYDIFG